MKRRLALIAACMLALCLAFSACAETVNELFSVQDMRMAGEADSFVSCPVFSGAENAPVLNALVQEHARIQDYLTLLSQITEGSTGLKMDYRMIPAEGQGSVISLVFSAEGKMLIGRPSQVYYPMVIDVENGCLLTAESVFTDIAAAEEMIGMYLENEVAPLLSTHLENSELYPVPMDRLILDESGITFYYDVKQLSFLSGFAGAVTVPYHVLEEYLNLEEGSVLVRMGIANKMLAISEETKTLIQNAAENGRLGPLPAAAGTDLDTALDVFRSTVDAGYYPGGAYYEMEDSRLRGSILITDENESVVTGILSKDVSLFGIITGKTTQEEWRDVLGEPVFTLEMGESESEPYLLCPGISDYYEFGEFELMLHADADGVLHAVRISN